jgi:hypothetical protein
MGLDRSYEVGRNAGLDALNECEKSGSEIKFAISGLLVIIIHSVYAFAPNKKIAEELINIAHGEAKINWEKENDKKR